MTEGRQERLIGLLDSIVAAAIGDAEADRAAMVLLETGSNASARASALPGAEEQGALEDAAAAPGAAAAVAAAAVAPRRRKAASGVNGGKEEEDNKIGNNAEPPAAGKRKKPSVPTAAR